MASTKAIIRLKKEYARIISDPIEYIEAVPLESNILEWNFIVTGPKDTPYANGKYHGQILFPPEYPFKAPSFKLFTPNGRFTPNTLICLSFSQFHQETWNPLWGVGSMLTGFLSFMLETATTFGSEAPTSDDEKRRLASESMKFNLANKKFRDSFPEMKN
jgi:ubiquitin-conjugating enzyme E2 J2